MPMSTADTNFDHLQACFADRYVIQRELGRGGMATVYLAIDPKHDREIAIKVLHPEVSVGLGSDRFLREIRIAAKLNHPHIVAFYDSGEASGILYYVMPYIKGESLRHKLKREKKLEVDEAIRIIRDLGSALHYAHGQGLIHRDIKPENILLHEGEAVVADFGIALALSAAGGERLTQAGVSLGTPEYMSPEQISEPGELDARSDIYAMGCVLYEMLCGEPPFLGASAQAVIAKHLADPVPSVQRLRESVPPRVDRALKCALSKSPVDRFRTVRDFVEFLVAPDAEPQAASTQTLVVLPFASLSSDPEDQHFSDGLTEEISADLSKIHGIRVISRTSAMRLKGTDKDLKTIGRELNVRYVLEGSVRKAGQTLRITAQLIDAANDVNLWSHKYTGTVEDLFDIQEQVARSIASALRVKLSTQEEEQIARRGQGGPGTGSRVGGVSWEPWKRHLSGRYHWYRFTPDGVHKAKEGFERAIQRDPDYAPAHVGLAESYLMLGGAPLNILPSAETIPIVKKAAGRAIQLNPSDGSAYEPLALAQCWFEGTWEAARQTAIRGTQLDPQSARAWRAYAHTHCVSGLFEDAANGAARFLELDPSSPQLHAEAAWIHCHARNYARAEQLVRRARELEPGFPLAAYIEAEIRLAEGDPRGALAVITPWQDEMRTFDYGLAILGYALARNGDREAGVRIAADLEELSSHGRAAWSGVALVHLALGSPEQSLTFLARASRQRPFGGVMTAYLAVHPLFDPLRNHAGFIDVLRTLGLESYRGARTDT
jgi:eukaryotic-like serine/threonine-protein kinase